MCLAIRENSRKQTAKKDIVCYKAIMPTKVVNPGAFNTGDHFTATINGCKVKGQIVIAKVNEQLQIVYCTNNKDCDGYTINIPEPLSAKYKYTWIHDELVVNCIIDRKKVKNYMISCYKTKYREAIVALGETYTSELNRNSKFIEEGLHSYKSALAAKTELYDNSILVKCIIPKDSKYYVGVYCGYIAYASDTLTYVEIIK